MAQLGHGLGLDLPDPRRAGRRRGVLPRTAAADSIARQVRITLRDQDLALPPGTDRITEIIATEITRHANPPA